MGKRARWLAFVPVVALVGCAGPEPGSGGGVAPMALQCVHDAQGECKVDLLPASGPPFPQNIEAHKGNRPNYPKLHFRLRPTAGIQFVNGGIVFESGSPITCDQKGPFQVLCDNNGTAPGGPFKYSILLSNRTIDPFVLNK